MTDVAAGFNKLAPFYNTLSRIVFLNSLEKSQKHFLSHISATDNVLILGGGSGNFLKALLQKHPGLHIDYIDISPVMLKLAQEKARNATSVNFLEGTELSIPETTYSVVITNFYLDVFSEATLKQIILKIKKHIQPHTKWVVTDFVKCRFWQRIILWLMYRFFRLFTGIEANTLPDWRKILNQTGFEEMDSAKFYGGFIKSSLFKIR